MGGRFKKLVVLALVVLVSGCGKEIYDPKAVQEDFVSLTGDQFTIFKAETETYPDLGETYVVSVYAPQNISPAALRQLEDNVFAGYAGALAELKVVPTVAVQHFSSQADYVAFAQYEFDDVIYDWNHQKFEWSAKQLGLDNTMVSRAAWSVWAAVKGYHQHLDRKSPTAVYKRGADGIWTRNGTHPGRPPHLREVTLDSGARFALTGSFDRPKDHVLMYECLSCTGDQDVDGVMRNFPDFMQSVVRPDAVKFDRTVRISIYAGERKDLWHFPSSIDLKVDPHNKASWAEGARQIAPGLEQLWRRNLRGSRSVRFFFK